MKRFLAILLTLLLAFPVAMAEPGARDDQAALLAARMPQMAVPEVLDVLCPVLYAPSWQVQLDAAVAMTWQQPVADVYLFIDFGAVRDLALYTGVSVKPALLDMTEEMLPGAITNAMMSRSSVDAMAISGVMGVSVAYMDAAQPDGSVVFLRLFADGAPLLYHISAHGGAVVMTCQPIFESLPQSKVLYIRDGDVYIERHELEPDGLPLADCTTAAEVQSWIDRCGAQPVQATETPVVMPLQGMALPDAPLVQNAAALIVTAQSRLAVLAEQMQQTDPEQGAQVALCAAEDFTQPRMILAMEVDVMTVAPLLWGDRVEQLLGGDYPGAAQYMTQTSATQTLTTVLAKGGDMAALTVASASSWGGLYADASQPDGSGVLLLFGEGSCVMAVPWMAENGVVTLSAFCMMLPELAACRTAEEVQAWMAALGLPVTLTEVNPE